MRDFNRLWSGQTISAIGSALTSFALPTLAILGLHATAFQVGVLTALQTLPFPVFGLLVGVMADRFSRRTMMIVSDLVRFAALASIPIASAFGLLRLPQLYAVAVITGIGMVVFSIAYQSYVPVLIDKDRLTSANSKLEISNSGAKMAGEAFAGIFIQWIEQPRRSSWTPFLLLSRLSPCFS